MAYLCPSLARPEEDLLATKFREYSTGEVGLDPRRWVRHARWRSTCGGHYAFLMYKVGQSPRSVHKKCARRTWCCAKTTSIHRAPSLSCQSIGGVGPGRPGISLGSGMGTGRSEPTTPQGEPRPHKGKPRAAHFRPVGRAAPQAQSVAQLSGGTGGLGHTSENRPGGNGPWAHRSVHGVTEVSTGSRPSVGAPDPP